MTIASFESRTMLPPEDHTGLEAALSQLLVDAPVQTVLEGPDGQRVELPPELFEILRDVTLAMAQGRAVTIATHEQVLSTQEAAELIGVSRPTFVAILERGELAYSQPGRHRRVRLADVLDYQRRQRVARRSALDELSRDAEQLGIGERLTPVRAGAE